MTNSNKPNPKMAPAPRPPFFMRRFSATETTDPNALVGLACDESYFVRRQAVKNPATPDWILDMLVRAGATPGIKFFHFSLI